MSFFPHRRLSMNACAPGYRVTIIQRAACSPKVEKAPRNERETAGELEKERERKIKRENCGTRGRRFHIPLQSRTDPVGHVCSISQGRKEVLPGLEEVEEREELQTKNEGRDCSHIYRRRLGEENGKTLSHGFGIREKKSRRSRRRANTDNEEMRG